MLLRPVTKVKPIHIEKSIAGTVVETEDSKFFALKCSSLPIVGQVKRLAEHRPVGAIGAVRTNTKVIGKIHL